MRRNNLSGDAIHPSATQIAIICTKIDPDGLRHLRPLMAHRAWQPQGRESGWFVGCCNRKHNHDNPDELALAPLQDLITYFPALFPYLALPVGHQLLFEEQQVIIFQPNAEEGYADPEPPLEVLPA